MFQSPTQLLRDSSPHVPRRIRNRGYSLLELIGVIAIGMIMAAMSLPIIKSVLQTYRLQSAASTISGGIASTRYKAIVDGCPYAIAIKQASNTYQVSTTSTGGTCAAAFSNVGPAIPFGYTTQIGLNQDTTFQFSPGGSVQVTSGAQSFTLSYIGTTNLKTVQVSSYGSVTVQ